MRKYTIITSAALLVATLWALAGFVAQAYAAPGDFLFTIGEPTVYARGTFVTVDSSGNNRYLITDSTIVKADPAGNVLARWGSFGSGNGQFQYPMDIALDSSGNVYVADLDNDRIQKFDASGNYLTQWGSYGQGNGQLTAPWAVAADRYGNVYVAEYSGSRIQKFDSSGTYLTQWGSMGDADGQFSGPQDLAVDGNGNVYVLEPARDRIQKFTGEGTFLFRLGSHGTGPGQFNNPQGIAVDSQGNLFVSDAGNNRIQKFNSSGSFLAQFGSAGGGNGQFQFPGRIAVDGTGNLYVNDGGNGRLQIFSNSGSYLSQIGSLDPGKFGYPRGAAVDSQGQLYVSDTGDRIQVFGTSGQFIAGWSTPGALRMAFDASDNVYIAGRLPLLKLSPAGSFLLDFGKPPEVLLISPDSIAADDAGNVYVVDTHFGLVEQFDTSGNHLKTWPDHSGSEPGRLQFPDGIASDRNGFVYISDTYNDRVQKFDSAGNLVTLWGGAGTGSGQFSRPDAIAADASGNVYVADGSRVQVFGNTGGFVAQLGAFGTGPGEFDRVRDLACDRRGTRVFVVDPNNHRVQVFEGYGSSQSFSLHYAAGPGGSIAGETQQTVAAGGSGSQVSAVPDPGYHFGCWSDGLTSASRSDSNVRGDLNLTASFVAGQLTYTLSFLAGPNGTIQGTSPEILWPGGWSDPITAVPDAGYRFVNWTGDHGFATTSENPLQVKYASATQTITANFAPLASTALLSYAAGPNGSLNGQSQQVVALGGNGTQVTAVANWGYHFVSWSDGLTSASRTDSNVTGNLSVTAAFAADQVTYTLSFSAGTGGRISGTTPEILWPGGWSDPITAIANPGYHFVNWTGDNGFVTSCENPLQVKNASASQNIRANFAADQTTYTFTFSAGAGGSISGASPEILWPGGWSDPITAIPNAGYHFVNWTGDNGFLATSENPLRVKDAAASQNITANFAANP